MHIIILPHGEFGSKNLPVCHSIDAIMTCDGPREGPGACLDWWNDRLQIVVYDNSDEPALHIRYQEDGTIAEVIVREDLFFRHLRDDVAEKLFKCEGSNTDWQEERDRER